MFKNEKNKGILSLVSLAASTAVIALVVRFLSEYLNPYWQLFTRISLAFVLTIILFSRKISIKNIIKASRKDLGLVFLRSVAHFAGIVLWVVAVTKTKLFTVALIDSIPFSAILGWGLMREEFTLKKLLWTLTAFSGVMLISLKYVSGSLTLGIGEILLILSGFLLAFRMVSVRWHHQKLNDWELSLVILLLSGLLLAATLIVRKDQIPAALLLPNVIWLTTIGGILNISNLYFAHYGYRKIEAVFAGNILQSEILFGLLLGFLFFKELPDLREITGSIILLISIYQINSLYKNR